MTLGIMQPEVGSVFFFLQEFLKINKHIDRFHADVRE